MVDIEKRLIRIQGKDFPIFEFSTWWAIEGLGLFSTLEEVGQVMPEGSLNLVNVRPVPVAVSSTPGVYEAL